MPSQVIVPHQPGPLLDVPEHRAGMGVPEIALSAGGLAVLGGVLVAGWPAWLSVVAVACLALGLALPAHAVLLRAQNRLHGGRLLDVSDDTVGRLVAAYQRLERTAGRGAARDAAHLAVAEVAELLDGRPPGEAEKAYVARRAEAVSTLADRLTGQKGLTVDTDSPEAPDSIARIDGLLDG